MFREYKEALADSYIEVGEEDLSNNIRQAENSADRCENKENLSLINDSAGRKNKSSSLMNKGSAEERL